MGSQSLAKRSTDHIPAQNFIWHPQLHLEQSLIILQSREMITTYLRSADDLK